MSCHRICSIYTPVLSAGAAKTYHQAFKISFDIFFHVISTISKTLFRNSVHSGLLFQEIFYFFIPAGLCFHSFHPAGI